MESDHDMNHDMEAELLHEWECPACGKGCSEEHGTYYCEERDEWCCTECDTPVWDAEIT